MVKCWIFSVIWRNLRLDSVWHRAEKPREVNVILPWQTMRKHEHVHVCCWKKRCRQAANEKKGIFFCLQDVIIIIMWESQQCAAHECPICERGTHGLRHRVAGMSSNGILSHLHTFACSLQGRGFDLSGSFPLTCAGSNQAINHNLWCSKHVHFKETFAFVEQSRPSLRATLDANSEALVLRVTNGQVHFQRDHGSQWLCPFDLYGFD